MNPSITVAIVTRNRANDLRECLRSLSLQVIKPKKILIVNNDSSDATPHVIHEFMRILPIKVVIEKTIGYPVVYNRALHETKTTWTAFIDDDCVADMRWYSELAKAVERFSGHAAIAGASLNYYPKNSYACAFQFWYEYWRRRSIHKTSITDYRTLDSRNIVYNKKLLFKHKIAFDNTFSVGAEDSDVGLQIQNKDLKAKYLQEAKVFHKEPKTMSSYIRKKQAYAVALRHLTKKWKTKKLPLVKRKQLELMRTTFRLATKQLSPLGRLKTFCIVFVDYVFSRYHVYELSAR